MKFSTLCVAAVLAFSGASAASAVELGFDDLGTGSFTTIPTNYQGFVWDYWASVNAVNYGPSGYANGVVSGGNSACGCAADFSETISSINAAGKIFTLESGFFTSAWNDGATLLVEGFASGSLLFSTTSVLDTSGPSFLSFGWTGLDEVQFSISGGTPSGLPGSGDYFAVDNLNMSVNVVPEPEAWTMMILGFGLAGTAMRRRRTALAV